MKKFLVLGLIFTNWSVRTISAYPGYQPPVGQPTASTPGAGNPPGNTANNPKQVTTPPAPAWLTTDPWFGDGTNTVKIDSSLGDSSWTTIDQQGGASGTPDATPSPFAIGPSADLAPNEDIPAGP